MHRNATLVCFALLTCSACEGNDDKSAAAGAGDEKEAEGADSLRSKLDAYFHEGAVESSVECMCDGDPEQDCEVFDTVSPQLRRCYVDEAVDEEEVVKAFFDCATPIMKRYNECMMALDSCESAGASTCESGYAEMLQCRPPSRAIRLAWDACNEEF